LFTLDHFLIMLISIFLKFSTSSTVAVLLQLASHRRTLLFSSISQISDVVVNCTECSSMLLHSRTRGDKLCLLLYIFAYCLYALPVLKDLLHAIVKASPNLCTVSSVSCVLAVHEDMFLSSRFTVFFPAGHAHLFCYFLCY
jgi:hypothetical protein